MEDEKKNAKENEKEVLNGLEERITDDASQAIEGPITKNKAHEDTETTPTIIKKLHRRQISTASAKMFALNEEIFPGEGNDSIEVDNGMPKYSVEQHESEETSKEVRFEGRKGDSGISRSINRSDVDRTSDTQITSGIGTIETGFETLGTSHSSINKGRRIENNYSKLKGIKLIF